MTRREAITYVKEVTGMSLPWDDNHYEALQMAIDVLSQSETHEKRTKTHACDLISRQAAIDALWKALFNYEEKTEKQFLESEELDVGDWIEHRIFVQNMNDIDRQVILELPSAQPEQGWIPCSERLPDKDGLYLATNSKLGAWNVSTEIFYKGRWVGDHKPIAWMRLQEPFEG